MYNYNYFMNSMFKNNNNNFENNNMPSLFTPAVGYDNGNLFANLYDQYKNYKPVNLRAGNERDNLLLEISRNSFAAHELNLYLDLNPNDSTIITLFNDYRERADKLIREYEAKYGPMTISSDNLTESPFAWQNDIWPWEDNFYV